MNIRDYIFIARPDHWPKNLLVLPGYFFAILLCGFPAEGEGGGILLVPALLACCLFASANYIINEYLDAEYDRHHPTKKNRPGARGTLRAGWVYAEYALCIVSGISLALSVSPAFCLAGIIFVCMGVVYNVNPVRAKERAYLDVVVESANNPVRFMLGWLIWAPSVFPPSSILLAYWAGGGFLMAVKRYAEYRMLSGNAALYRRSFERYTERSLLLYSFFCALCSAFFGAVFLMKYRVEYLLLFPFIAFLFVWYLSLGMDLASHARSPEKLFYNKNFLLYLVFMSCLTTFLSVVDIPVLYFLNEKIGTAGR